MEQSKSEMKFIFRLILNHARDHSVREGLDYVSVWNSVMLNTQDIPLALQAALSKKKAVYPKL
jgi:delta(3,5)-delta(2,4)-dienoyl-CoA isomerase